ncbi:MAG: hypothetical protein Q8Q33_02605, partial [Chlamydiota bacterium]|nr:hypothetical protein [Chlamydiota bacterium]
PSSTGRRGKNTYTLKPRTSTQNTPATVFTVAPMTKKPTVSSNRSRQSSTVQLKTVSPVMKTVKPSSVSKKSKYQVVNTQSPTLQKTYELENK